MAIESFILSMNVDKKSLETEFLIAIKNTVSSDFLSMFLNCLECFGLPPIWSYPRDWNLTRDEACGVSDYIPTTCVRFLFPTWTG